MTNSSTAKRGDRTREQLLDAVEAIAAEHGTAALSHRAIARRANLHAGLLHYHFGTIERLLEEAVARRAARFSQAQLTALSALFARGRWTVEDVIAALWRPFSSLGGPVEDVWRNYLCMVARLANSGDDHVPMDQHFGDVTRAARRALQAALPGASDEAVDTGLRYTRVLFEQEALQRCARAYSRAERVAHEQRLAAFAAAGLRALAGEPTRAIGVSAAKT